MIDMLQERLQTYEQKIKSFDQRFKDIQMRNSELQMRNSPLIEVMPTLQQNPIPQSISRSQIPQKQAMLAIQMLEAQKNNNFDPMASIAQENK